jgi:hypothetical protein
VGFNPIASAIGTALMKKLVNISEYIVTFHVGPFIKMFLYHLIFYYFGPLVLVVISIFDSTSLSRNMMFFGWTEGLKAGVFTQYLYWFLSFIVFTLYLLKELQLEIHPGVKVELKNIYSEQLLFFSVQIFIRSFIVAVRYGYSSPLRYHVLKSTRKDAAFISRDLMVVSWFNTTP